MGIKADRWIASKAREEARMNSNKGIAQVLFFYEDEPCEVSCADRKGKYQKQQSILLPRL